MPHLIIKTETVQELDTLVEILNEKEEDGTIDFPMNVQTDYSHRTWEQVQ